MKGIKREFSVASTPQQNGVVERKNRTLIEAARTMLADSKLPTTFWVEAVNTACYVQNRVLVIKPYNKTPYELFLGRNPALSFMRPFGCPVTIFNTIDHIGKFDGKADEGFFVGFSTNIKAFRVFNSRTRIVEENLHMDVKSAFLYGKIEEEVYVCQPPGFEDPDFPDRVYKVEMALYGLHQDPRAWTASEIEGKWDFISQDKYVTEILKKFSLSDVKTENTPMETHKPLLKDADGEDVDEHMYRSMIGSLIYLTSSRLDIMFDICVCARFQVNHKVSHLHAVKRIFRYLKGQPKLGLWYPKDSPFDLVSYTDSDYAGARLDRKSTIGGCQFIGCRLISWQYKKQTMVANSTIEAGYVAASSCCGQFWATAKVKTVNGEVQLQALVDGKKEIITKTSVRRDLQLEDAEGIECLPNDDIFEQLNLIGMVKNVDNSVKFLMYLRFVQVFLDKQIGDMSTHDEIFVTPSHTKKKKQKPRKPKRKYIEIPQSSGPIEPTADEAANEENVPTHSNDLLLSGKDSLKLNDLMEICTKLQQRVHDLENTKTAQAQEISSLKLRVKRLEKKGGSRTHKRKRLFKVGRSAQVVSSKDEGLGDQEDASKHGRKIDDIDQDAEFTLVDETQGSEKVVEEVVSTAEVSNAEVMIQELVHTTTTTTPSTIPKAKSITFRDPGESTTRTTLTPIPSNIKDKGKAKMIEPTKTLKKKEQIRLDGELAFKLQAKEEEQARLAREKAEKVEEANISWDNVQEMIEADRLLVERLQAREPEELTNEEKARLFVELLEKRKKHFAALRAQE
ncbi:uncharacterized mitochondrial protein-like protein [Tanacetum coccineum]